MKPSMRVMETTLNENITIFFGFSFYSLILNYKSLLIIIIVIGNFLAAFFMGNLIKKSKMDDSHDRLL
jgi:hypothetical protein